jgi:hypothetical protein
MRIITGFLGMLAAGALCTSAMAALSSVNTGFESPSFTTGGLNGQPAASPADEQWLVSGGGTNANVNVSTVHPNSGSQHIRITPLDTQFGNQTGAFSPIITIPNHTPTVTKFDVSVSGVTPGPVTGGSEYTVLLADRAHGRVAAEFELNYTGEIFVDSGGVFTGTGTPWTTDGYHTYEIDVTSSSTVFKRDGSTFFTAAPIPAADNGSDTADEIQIVSDNFGDPQTEVADFDNVSLSPVPEPAVAAFVSVLALSTARWSRGRRGGRSYTPVS